MSLKSWISVITLGLVAGLIYLSRDELAHAWTLLQQVDLRILWLVLITSIVGYLANGEMIFSYLQQKKLIASMSPLTLMRMSLELNFVNHALPSGGVSGISYLTWRLGKFGVSHGKATIAQLIRYVVWFASFTVLLVISMVAVTIDGSINRWIILISALLVGLMVGATLTGAYLLRSRARIMRFTHWFAQKGNSLAKRFQPRRKTLAIDEQKLNTFFNDMHEDYLQLSRDRKVLWRPFWWGIVFTIAEIGLFFVTFWALGVLVNPAMLLIAYGVATLAGLIVITPGGAGVYETLMVFILSIAGVDSAMAIAGIVLARMILMVITIGVGYIFYQSAINSYAGHDRPSAQV